MVYLYAGMGVVMLTGIMAIFEMGLSLTGQSLLPMPTDLYVGSDEQRGDSYMMDSFDATKNSNPVVSGLKGMDICDALKVNAYVKDRVGTPSGTFLPQGLDSAWDDGCVIEFGSHQILVVPNPSQSSSGLRPYLIVSCTIYDNTSTSMICPFVEPASDP